MTPPHAMAADMPPSGARISVRPKVARPPVWREVKVAPAENENIPLEMPETETSDVPPLAGQRLRAWEPRFFLLLVVVIVLTNMWMHTMLRGSDTSIQRIPSTEMGAYTGGEFLLHPATEGSSSYSLPLLARDVP